MFEAPELMRMAQELARHSGLRQSVTARNIAHADTPGFRARDIESFAETYQKQDRQVAARVTREGHIDTGRGHATWNTFDVPGRASPNGNTVSLEEEMVRGTQAQSSHTLALTVYKSSLDILRTALGRGR